MADQVAKNTLVLWDIFRAVPETAKRKIQGGHLNGKTDINPVWRMKALTEIFGPVGFGWNVREVERWTNECAGEVGAFVKVELKVFYNGQWSEPIEGTGGSKLCGKGRGEGINDEAWKMATTDAISVACKSLGIAADVYFEKDAVYGTKYETSEAQRETRMKGAYRPMSEEKYWKCVEAHALGKLTKDGRDILSFWQEETNSGKREVDKFLNDVENFKIANQIQ